MADVTEDGILCAVASDGTITIYNTLQDEPVSSVTLGSSTVKYLKISPSKECISWLELKPNIVYICFIGSAKQKIRNTIKSEFNDEFILWNPAGNLLAVFSSHSMFIDIFNIEDGNSDNIASISGAKFNCNQHPIAQFSRDGEMFATVNVSTRGPVITIYSTTYSWNCIQRIFINGCDDVGGLLWCVDCASLLVWQAQRELRLQLWTLYGRQEQMLSDKSARVLSVCLTDCGRLAAVLTDDAKVRILDLLTWQTARMGVMVHQPVLQTATIRCAVEEPNKSRGQINVNQFNH